MSSRTLTKEFSNHKYSNTLTIFLFILLIISSINNINSSIKIIGLMSLLFISTIAVLVYLFHLTKVKAVFKTHFELMFIATFFITILLIGLLGNLTTRGFIVFFQFLLMFGFALSSSTIRWSSLRIKRMGIVTSIFVLFNFMLWALTGFQSFFKSIYSGSNLVGVYMLYSMFFILLARSRSQRKSFYTLIGFMALLVLYGSDTRSAMVAGIFGIGTYVVWNFICKKKSRFVGFILLIYTFLLSFVFIYPNLPKWKYYEYFEMMMLKYTGKSLMSGRDTLWSILLEKINDRPLLGYGTGTQLVDVSGISKSSHNLYLQITMQNGYLGLVTFLLLIFTIWLLFWKARHIKTVRLVAAFFVATLIYQLFEITFTQNILSIGLMQWFIISIGISFCLFGNISSSKKM